MLSQRSLEAFHTVLECGSVSGAAELMHVSQPAVSRLIRDLEERTGLRLFTRFGGKIVPTAEARELAIEVERSFQALSTIEKAARDIRLGKRGTVSIAAIPALAHSILPDALVDLLAEQPQFRVSLQSMQTHNVIRQVATRQSQLGFTAPTRHEYDVDLIRTIDLPYRCILPQDHPLASKDYLSVEDFSAQKMVAYIETTATGSLLDRHFSKMSVAPDIVVRTQLSTIVSALVLRGLGMAVVDPFTARVHETQGGLALNLASDIGFRLAIIRPRGISLGPDLEAFLEAFDSQVAHYQAKSDA
ncbi:LysR substrate-binding domain-containing protein [Kordiimonas sp.]|uniref:LysR substrate-binding domain-containing protein n=1 Tax=Kordiimonas sp. TaxID=1970157 RepID=UPI003A913998